MPVHRRGPGGQPGPAHGAAPGDPEHPRPQTDSSFAAQVARFNDPARQGRRPTWTRPAHPCCWPRLPPSYDFHTDTYDGTHPNATGEHKLAAAFAEALYQAWGVGGPYEQR